MLDNIKLSTKIFIGFGILLLLMFLVSYFGLSSLSTVADRMKKTDDADQMVKSVLSARLQEKNFIIRGEKQSVDKVHEQIDGLKKLANETKGNFKNKVNIAQMDELLVKINTYSEAFRQYVSLEESKVALMGNMSAKAIEASDLLEDLGADQRDKAHELLEKLFANSGLQTEVYQTLAKADDAKNMINWFLEVRKNEKEFIISGDSKYIIAVGDGVQRVVSLGKDLKSRFKETGDINRISSVLEALSVYQTAFNESVAKIAEQKKAEMAMVEAAHLAGQACETARLNQKDAMEIKMKQAKTMMFGFAGAAVLLGFFIAAWISMSLKKSMNYAVKITKNVAAGDLTQEIKVAGQDEMGTLLAAMGGMVKSLNRMFLDIAKGVETIASSSTELSTISRQMTANSEQSAGKAANVAMAAEEMSANLNSVAAAAEQASRNVGVVASAAEEMSLTINEIAQNAEKGKNTSSKAVRQATGASRRIEELEHAAKQVGEVTDTIMEISEQTDLLALNATIEAARAGEAGRGFAVVANEIKELSKQTAAATQKIRQQIEGIQETTLSTVEEIKEMAAIINEVNEAVRNIASSIEEQSIATKEIAQNVAQASQGIQEVTQNVSQTSTVSAYISKDISEVNGAAQEINNASSQVQMSARDLSSLSERLKDMVEQFKLSAL